MMFGLTVGIPIRSVYKCKDRITPQTSNILQDLLSFRGSDEMMPPLRTFRGPFAFWYEPGTGFSLCTNSVLFLRSRVRHSLVFYFSTRPYHPEICDARLINRNRFAVPPTSRAFASFCGLETQNRLRPLKESHSLQTHIA